jgi:hypothetical protein
VNLGNTAQTDVLPDHQQASQLVLFRKAVQTGLFPNVKFIATVAMLECDKVAVAFMNRLDVDGDNVKKDTGNYTGTL